MTDQTEMTPTVFVVDDDPEFLESMEGLIQAIGHRVLTFHSAAQFRRYYERGMPGCLLLDIFMPRQNGVDLYELLLEKGVRLPAIFVTAHADVSVAVAAMKTGAMEFLEKPFERTTLEALIERALDLDLHWRQRQATLDRLESRIASLSTRERETLDLIMEGCPNKVMAARLNLTERAIEMRRASIMRKLEVDSLAELLKAALTHSIVNDIRELRKQRGFIP